MRKWYGAPELLPNDGFPTGEEDNYSGGYGMYVIRKGYHSICNELCDVNSFEFAFKVQKKKKLGMLF